MLEIKRFDGGMKGRKAALLHCVSVDRRNDSARHPVSSWSLDCTPEGEPKRAREVSALAAPRAPMHDREEVAVHA
jgi:hypothetical protein